MEIINYLEEHKKSSYDNVGLIPWLIAESMSALTDNWDKTFPNLNAEKLEIEMKINGVEVPVRKTLELIEEQLDKLIQDKAKELLERKFRIHETALETLKEHVISQLDNNDYRKEELTNNN